MISEIVTLRNEGFSIKEIADELNLTMGKVRYQLREFDNNIQHNKIVVRQFHEHSSQCTLMVRSPYSLFCYWEISDKKRHMVKHHLNDEWGSFDLQLRLYDVTKINFNGHNAHCFQDYLLPRESQQWFFYDLNPNRTYCVDIGVITREKRYFFPFIRSNTMATPHLNDDQRGLSTSADLQWKEGIRKEPDWLEGFSSYSYYEKLK
ncbi:DUF4912 domain-containing protein [Anaerobacillus alkaliphilus]|uniref:DUF4912 domain-containing protein n=1 Tax=Anaerobacillus alkaliphilus TaxID=1548597 RepID=A0A4Q0VQN2_9BACI|nr:DUF4912 domain-containing protein [Anaerobacillus alkaliphilus]RXI99446.1 DUF4912 domain-containing protein [Anaerobacillus alkaliphilus]